MRVMWFFMFMLVFMVIIMSWDNILSNLFLLMIFTIIMCMSMSFTKNSYFISFVIFLVMIGGLMVMFLLFMASMPNVNLKFYMKKLFNFIYTMIFTSFLFPKDFLNSKIDLNSVEYMSEFSSINLAYSFDKGVITLTLTFYVMIVMLCVVKISLKLMKPLKSKF